MKRQIILDTETTGLKPEEGHRVIEIGCLEMINRKLTGRSFHYYINPCRAVERDAQEIHGLTQEFLADKPTFAQIVSELIDFVEGAELIIHNAPFDIGFLNAELKRCESSFKLITDYCTVVDTLALARRKHPGQHNNLDALCRRYQVDNSNRELHGALIDTELLAKVYLAMTGGQTQLFTEHDAVEVVAHRKIAAQKIATQRVSLPIIRATLEELAEHEAFLALLRKSGQCLWIEDK